MISEIFGDGNSIPSSQDVPDNSQDSQDQLHASVLLNSPSASSIACRSWVAG